MSANWSIRVNESTAIPVGHPKEIVSPVMDSIQDLKYWSADALKDLHNGLIDLGCHMASQMAKRDGRWASRMAAQKIKKTIAQEGMLQKIYTMLLNSEGLGIESRAHIKFL